MADTQDASTEVSNKSKASSFWRHPLWLVMLGGIVFRLYNLAGHSLWYDESTTILGSTYVDWSFTFLSASESRLQPLNSVLCFMLVNFGERILGIEMGSVASDFYLRLMPTLFSVGIIWMTFVLAMRLFQNQRAALIASWFVALSPFHVYYAQEFRPHTLYALLVTAGMYCSLRALEDGGKKYWIGTVVCGTLAFYSYYFSAFFLLSMNVYALACFKRYRSKIVPWTLSQLTILVLIIPPILMALRYWRMHTSAEDHWFPHPTLKTALLTLKNFFAGYSPNIPLYWALFFFGSAILVLGLIESRKFRHQAKFILCLAAFPILFQIAFWATQNFAFYTYRIQLAFTVPIYILMGLGVSSVRVRAGRVIIVGLFTVLTIPALRDVYQQNLHPVWDHVIGVRYKVDSRSAATMIKEQWQSGDVLAHSSTFSYPPFRYHYFQNEDQRILAFTDEEFQLLLKSYPDEKAWTTLGFVPQRIEEVIAGKQRVWYVQSGWDPFSEVPLNFEFRSWLDAHGTRLRLRRFDGIQVYLYDLTQATEPQGLRYRRVENGHDHIDDMWSPEETPAADTEDEQQLWPSRPLTFRFYPEESLDVRNTSDATIDLTRFAYPSIDSFPALAFDREPDSNVWRPSSSYFRQPTMLATLDVGEVGLLTYTATLPEGRMNLLIRIRTFDDGIEQGVIELEIAQGVTILLSSPVSDPKRAGWTWVDAGLINSGGGETNITVTASRVPSGRPAVVEWERIAFVEPALVESFLSPKETVMDIPGNRTTQIPLTIPFPDARDSRRIDYEFRDNENNGYTLYYYR